MQLERMVYVNFYQNLHINEMDMFKIYKYYLEKMIHNHNESHYIYFFLVLCINLLTLVQHQRHTSHKKTKI